MPVGRPRRGELTLRIPGWMHEELAAEGFERNVSLNRICFEALVLRRELRKSTLWQRTARGLDARRERNLAQVLRAVTECAQEIVRAGAPLPDLDQPSRKILDALRERPASPRDIASRTGLDEREVELRLRKMELLHNLVKSICPER
ncbi:MAG TPA: toxin-antitoxin system HicB family antitoxin [Polyangia bacterium]|nr:toxin-antitoxin system HicB family antitoxin [Polyangia bacterium]